MLQIIAIHKCLNAIGLRDTLQYNTIQLIFDIALLPYSCQAQKCTYTPWQHRCNCHAEHCWRGTCSRALRGSQRI